VQIKSLIKGGKYNIVKPHYLTECITETVLVPLREFHVWYATEETRSHFQRFEDQYGDSYIDPVTPESLALVLLTDLAIRIHVFRTRPRIFILERRAHV
jgi:hypothetical protein